MPSCERKTDPAAGDNAFDKPEKSITPPTKRRTVKTRFWLRVNELVLASNFIPRLLDSYFSLLFIDKAEENRQHSVPLSDFRTYDAEVASHGIISQFNSLCFLD